MNMNSFDNQEQHSAIAIVKTDAEFRAAEIQKHNGTVELLWMKSRGTGETTWQSFAAECGLSVDPTDPTQSDSDKIVVVGFDSTGTAFYRVVVPQVEEKDIESIVTLQAESRLPLPVDQMELAWHTSPAKNGHIAMTIAASRKQNVKAFVNSIKSLQPTHILLDCEAVIKAWNTFFPEPQQHAVIINAGTQNTQVCLVQDGQLSNTVVLEMGINDFAETEAEEVTETTERFIQDMRGIIDLFGRDQSANLPVFVLSDGSPVYINIVSALKLQGLNVRAVSPDPAKFGTQNELSMEDLYHYRVPLGLALMGLETDTEKLNLFKNVYFPAGKQKDKHWLYTPKVVYAISAAMIALCVLVFYAVDLAKPGTIEKRIKAAGSEADINLLMERQKLKKTIAQQRPDLLQLLNEITSSGQGGERSDGQERGGRRGRGQSGGIQLESFHFKKGQPVLIAGQASNNEQLYTFEKSLEEQTNIREVRRTATQIASTAPSSTNPRGMNNTGGRGTRGGTKFTITFHYKNFTR